MNAIIDPFLTLNLAAHSLLFDFSLIYALSFSFELIIINFVHFKHVYGLFVYRIYSIDLQNFFYFSKFMKTEEKYRLCLQVANGVKRLKIHKKTHFWDTFMCKTVISNLYLNLKRVPIQKSLDNKCIFFLKRVEHWLTNIKHTIRRISYGQYECMCLEFSKDVYIVNRFQKTLKSVNLYRYILSFTIKSKPVWIWCSFAIAMALVIY